MEFQNRWRNDHPPCWQSDRAGRAHLAFWDSGSFLACPWPWLPFHPLLAPAACLLCGASQLSPPGVPARRGPAWLWRVGVPELLRQLHCWDEARGTAWCCAGFLAVQGPTWSPRNPASCPVPYRDPLLGISAERSLLSAGESPGRARRRTTLTSQSLKALAASFLFLFSFSRLFCGQEYSTYFRNIFLSFNSVFY